MHMYAETTGIAWSKLATSRSLVQHPTNCATMPNERMIMPVIIITFFTEVTVVSKHCKKLKGSRNNIKINQHNLTTDNNNMNYNRQMNVL